MPFTYQDLASIPDDDKRRELIEGDLFVTPSPTTVHQTISSRLVFELICALERTGLARVFYAPTDVILDETNVVVPDIVIVSKTREHIITKRAIEGVPDVIVEILSPGTSERDRHYKRRLYERFYVPEYWLVDPEYGQIEILALVESEFRVRARYDRASILSCPLFATLNIELAPIFAGVG